MARGINKVILVGNLGNDPDTKYTQGGMAITRISLATTSVRKDKDGNQQERTEWHRVVFFGKLAEIAGEYLRKGSSVYVEGSLRYDKYTGQAGVEKYSTDIIADEMQMLGGKGDGGDNRQSNNQQRQQSSGNQGNGGQQRSNNSNSNGNRNAGGNQGNQGNQGNRGGGGVGARGGAPNQQRESHPAHGNNNQEFNDFSDDDIPFLDLRRGLF